ncbi:MAG: cyclic nucleotide-binding domain-containing protein [Mariprofundaceae bacterium]
MADQQQQQELERKAARYEQLCHIYPNDPKHLRRYAEILLQLDKEVQADHILERLHNVLIQAGQQADVKELEKLRQATIHSPHRHGHHSPLLRFINKKQGLFSTHKQIKLNQGEYLFRQGESDEDMYVLLGGELGVWVHAEDQKDPILVCHLKEGATVGEMAFLHGEKRCADVLANMDSELIKLPRKTVSRLLLKHPKVEKEIRQEADLRRHMTMISMNPILTQAPANLRRYLVQNVEMRCYPTFGIIAKEAEPIEEVGVVISGLVRRITEDYSGDSHVFESIKAGHMLGWEASVQDHSGFSSDTHLTSLIAMQECNILFIPMSRFCEVLDMHPPLKVALSKEMNAYLSGTLSAIRDISRL